MREDTTITANGCQTWTLVCGPESTSREGVSALRLDFGPDTGFISGRMATES
jgi:hypothetical protein